MKIRPISNILGSCPGTRVAGSNPLDVKTLRVRLLFLDGASIEPENNLSLERLQYPSLFSSINTTKNGQNLVYIIILGQFLP